MSSNHFDVLISGLGPTGATLAGLLGQRGVRVAVFDRLADLYPLPRAIGLDHEAMRIVQELGLAERMADHIAAYRPSEYLGMDGMLIKRLDTQPEPHALGWAPNYVFSQPAFERVLRDRLNELDTVTTFVQTEIVNSGQDNAETWVEVRSHGEDKLTRLTGQYLVACDGGSSSIRKRLGIALEDLGFDEPWLVVDAFVSAEKLLDLPQTQVQYCEAQRPSTFVVGPGNHRRWEIMLNPGDSVSAEFPDEELWPLLERWIKPGEAQLWRSAAYRFHGLLAREWSKGRTFLAGDAAHMTPPFMAQGMVQGMRDAHNLAWKLDRVLKGESSSQLLDTYATERQPHVRKTTLTAMELGRVICERDPDKARERDKKLRADSGGVVKTVYRQQMIPGLTSGLIAHEQSAAGSIFPQPTVQSADQGGLLDDLLRGRALILINGELNDSLRTRYQEAAQAVGAKVLELTGAPSNLMSWKIREQSTQLEDWFARHKAVVALVRPDHYVYGTASSFEAGIPLLENFKYGLQ